MKTQASTITEYIASVSGDRKKAFEQLRAAIKKNIPEGFKECMSYGMIGYVVPHSVYKDGYHCNPVQPLPFINIGNQKNFIVMHHLGIYGDTKLQDWFIKEYPKYTDAKLDMGKGCIRFKNPEKIPFALIGMLVKKITVKDWITMYEKNLKSRK